MHALTWNMQFQFLTLKLFAQAFKALYMLYEVICALKYHLAVSIQKH